MADCSNFTGKIGRFEKTVTCTNCHQIHPWRERGLSL